MVYRRDLKFEFRITNNERRAVPNDIVSTLFPTVTMLLLGPEEPQYEDPGWSDTGSRWSKWLWQIDHRTASSEVLRSGSGAGLRNYAF